MRGRDRGEVPMAASGVIPPSSAPGRMSVLLVLLVLAGLVGSGIGAQRRHCWLKCHIGPGL